MSFKAWIWILLGLLVGLMALSGALAVRSLRQVSAAVETLYIDRVVPMHQLRTVAESYRIDIATAVQRAIEGRATPFETVRAIDAARERAARTWDEYLGTYLVEEEKRLIDQAQPLLERADEQVAQAVDVLQAGDLSELPGIARRQMAPAFDALASVLQRLTDVQVQVAREKNIETQRIYGYLVSGTMALVLLAAGTGGLLAWLLVLRQQSESRAAEARAERLRRFYEALSLTSQMVVRERDAAVLLERICQICVSAGHARWASVSVVQDGRLVRVAAAAKPGSQVQAPASEELHCACDVDSPAVQAAETGVQAVSNDCRTGTARSSWSQTIVDYGIGSVAAFPVRRGQRVVAVLSLYADEAGFFDDPLVALLNEMASDLSFALDNIDRSAERLAAMRAVEKHEQQLSAIVESTMDAIITADSQRRIVVFNRAASVMFGVPAEHAIGESLDRFIPATAPERPGCQTDRPPPGANAIRFPGERHRISGRRSDGTEFPAEISVSHAGVGDEELMTAVIRDMTDAVEAERARRAQAQAEAASRAKTDFLSRMSHELRTPLNAVLGFAQLLRLEVGNRLDREQSQQLDHIISAGWHLLKLINDVLDVSRIEAGQLQIDVRGVSLPTLMDEAVRMVQSLAADKGVTVTKDRVADRLGVVADPGRLQQVLINLLSNAIKYNRPGGTVRVAAAVEGDLVTIDVVDTGIGMTEEQVQHLYEPFNRLGREATVEGTGIGLVVSRQLVTLMHGELKIDSEAGRGTRVRLALPAWEGGSQHGGLPMAKPTASRSEDPSGVVLYIEDNPVNLLLVEQMLSRWPGVTLLSAPNGRQGIKLARETMPDLVLLDMQLPDINGIEVLRVLRSDPTTQTLRIIALSAGAMPSDIERATRSGAYAYWTKPLDLQRFLSDVQQLLSGAPSPTLS